MRYLAILLFSLFVSPASAQYTWTGVYVGANVGYGWGERTADYSGNDASTVRLITGTFGLAGGQPFPANRFTADGATGGFQLGYNFQFHRSWLAGIEIDINGADISGSKSDTVFLSTAGPVTQTLSSEQRLHWFGTVRSRLGWLPTDSLLLFASGGLAYGRISQSNVHQFNGNPGAGVADGSPPFNYSCNVNTVCFTGSSSRIRAGWTVGGGGEWRFQPRLSLKAEYLYVNLGSDTVTATAIQVLPTNLPASYRATFAADYHIVRTGINWQF